MNIEDSIEILKNSKKLYLKEKIDSDILEEAIETLLTAYEKEKENNKELRKYYATRKEVEELREINECLHDSAENYISKDKIKAKIEEYENKIKKIRSKKIINEPEDTIIITRYAHYISVLQSLLEKE